MRLLKAFKIIKYNRSVRRFLAKLKMSSGVSRMAQTFMFALFMVHLFSCFWYMLAKFEGFSPSTWVARRGRIDVSIGYSYSESLYWSFQTLTTVGYGDFGAGNVSEVLINVVWMIFGVSFYSFVIGSVTSLISAEIQNTDTLNHKLKVLEDFGKESAMDEELMNKIRQFLLNNYNELFSKQDEEELLKELPPSLREEVLYHQFGGLVDSINMLRDCEDNEFVWGTVQLA